MNGLLFLSIKIWILGDGSGNELEFVLRHARLKIENDGRKNFYEHGQVQIPRIKMNFKEWKDLGRYLSDEPRRDQVGDRDLVNVTPL